jgi:uncharacterized protein with HEPN domain
MIDRLPLYLQQIEKTAAGACDYVRGMDLAAFLASEVTQRAVAMNLVLLGEIIGRLTKQYPEFLLEHPEIPWHDILGLRNRLAHGYFDINLNVVWDTTQNSLPELLSQLDTIRNWHAQGE